MGETLAAFFIGLVFALIIGLVVARATQPEIKREELYRFCLVKNIKLEDCRIPKHGVKDE